MKDNKKKKYIISFDIGTNSIGTAVMDLEGNLLKFNKKPALSTYLFEEGKTASNTAILRRNRRRLNHKRHLLQLLQETLKIEEEFVNRLSESSLYDEDRVLSSKSGLNSDKVGGYSLFNNDKVIVNGEIIENYTDKHHHSLFPTIHHLIYALKNSEAKYDVRLVYLALHNLLKRRGHFLIEGDLKLGDDSSKFESLKNIQYWYSEVHDVELTDAEVSSLEKLEGKSDLVQIIKKCEITKNRLKKVIKVNADKDLNLLDEKFDDEIMNLDLNDAQFELVKSIKLYAESVKLSSYLGDYHSISDRKIAIYDAHKEHLLLLKELISINKQTYKSVFGGKNSWYSEYLKHYNKFDEKKKILKKLNDIIKELEKENTNNELFSKKLSQFKEKFIVTDGKNESISSDFLPKQKMKENSLLPNQLFKNEYYSIIDNQSKYYNWSEKEILDLKYLIDFKIDYFVGPITRNKNNSKFSWVVFKEGITDKPTALNYKEIIDFEETEREFIKRMLRKCTYLKGDNTVLPRQSILYSEVSLLNELNNLSIYNTYGEQIILNRKMKEKLVNDLFSKQVNVSKKALIKFMNDNFMEIGVIEIIDGLANDTFTNNLYSKIHLQSILKEKYSEELAEKIIEILVIFEDRKKKEELILKLDRDLEEDLSKLSSLKITGWGKLSQRLLSVNVNYGENLCSIRDRLYDSNYNLQKILSEEPFKEYITAYNKENADEIIGNPLSKSNREVLKNVVDDLYASPSVKKAIKNTFDIYREVVKKMGGQIPEYISIEMARGKDGTGRTTTKYKQISGVYDEAKVGDHAIKQELKSFESKSMSLKEELYFRQLGRCMYTNKELSFEKLGDYEIDHILPRTLIKDDSIDNLVLVFKKINQDKATTPVFKYILSIGEDKDKILEYWSMLHNSKLISTKKYANLQIQEYTDEIISGFISRQLVATRQSTKIVSDLFENFFGFNRSKIYSISAKNTSELRNHPALKLFKNRDINDYHHAYDAYLSGLIALMKIKKNFNHLMKEKILDIVYESMEEDHNKNYKTTQSFIMSLFLKQTNNWDFKSIREKMYNYYINRHYFLSIEGNDPNEEFYNQTLYSKDKNGSNKIPLKKGKEPEKYGYYTSQKGHSLIYFSFINSENKKEFTKLSKKVNSDVIYIGTLDYLMYKGKYDTDKEIVDAIYLDFCIDKLKLSELSQENKEYILKNSVLIHEKLKSSVIVNLENHKSHLVQIVSESEFAVRKNYIPNIKDKHNFTIAIEILNSLSKHDTIFKSKILDYKKEEIRKKEFSILKILIDDLEKELSDIWYFDKHQEYLKILKAVSLNLNDIEYTGLNQKILDIKIAMLNAVRIITGSENVKYLNDEGKWIEKRKFRKDMKILSKSDTFDVIQQSKSGFFRKKVRFIVDKKGKK